MTTTGTERAAALRGLRALVFGTTVLVLAAAAHVAAGGALPTPPMLALCGVPVVCASVVLARRVRSTPTLFAALAATQFLLHELFMSTAAGATTCVTGPGAHTGHHAVAVSCDAMPSMVPLTHGAPSSLMIALHVLATVATALLLTHGERIVVRALTWVRPRLTAAVAPVPSAGRVTISARVAAPVVRVANATSVSRRGPPAWTAFAPLLPA